MIVSDIIRWVVDHHEYAPLGNTVVAVLALLFSVLTFVITTITSKRRSKKDRAYADKRFDEQKRLFEERLKEERVRWEEDRKATDARNRVSEEPFLVFKQAEVVQDSSSDKIILETEFVNKGRGAAYEIQPDTECKAISIDRREIEINRYAPVEDRIATVGESFVTKWIYNRKDDISSYRMDTEIKYEDASGHKYKQSFGFYINDGKSTTIYSSKPELNKIAARWPA